MIVILPLILLAVVDAPLTGRVGNIENTRVGPATLAPARAVPSTTGRY